MAAKKNLSVEEILALCRQTDGTGGTASPSTPAPSTPAPEAAAEASKPAAAAKKPGEMSVAEMLAAARAEKSGGGAVQEEEPAEAAETPAPAAKVSPADARKMSVAEMLAAARGEKSAAPAARAKPAAKKPSKPAAKDKASPKPIPSGPKDTSSILAAARKSVKPGPMSKAEAAQKAKADPKGKPKVVAPPMPERPAYAMAKSAPAAQSDRRGFMEVLFGSALALGFSSLAAISGLWSLGLARFMFPNILTEPPSRFKVGFPADFAPDTVTTKFKAQFGVWVVNTVYEGERQITALKSVCTHLGCTPNWLEGEQKFKCPCHGSGFYKEGINFEGPAPRPLERYAIKLADDGQIEIDKSKKFQQELGQWTNSSSYVAV